MLEVSFTIWVIYFFDYVHTKDSNIHPGRNVKGNHVTDECAFKPSKTTKNGMDIVVFLT